MFGDEFFPTPENVVLKMIDPYLTDESGRRKMFDKNTIVLDPEGGAGDILDVVFNRMHTRFTSALYCYETNLDLRLILQGKGYSVVGEDFLTEELPYFVNLIVMNPPFTNGDEHLLRAWNVLPEGDIVCLLNSETINNPYSKTRMVLLNLIEKYGNVEDLGPCFDTAERKTSVNISMVRLHKNPKEKRFFNDSHSYKNVDQEELNEIPESAEICLETPNLLKSLTRQYGKTLELTKEYFSLKSKIMFQAEYIQYAYSTVDSILENLHNKDAGSDYNEFVKKFTMSCWENIFNKIGFEKYMTGKMKDEFKKICEQQGAIAFTEDNITNFLGDLIASRVNIFKEAFLDVTERMMQFDVKNTCHTEGWKSNDAYKINKRVIVPYCLDTRFGMCHISHGRWGDFIDDIDKVLCNMTGAKMPTNNAEGILTIRNSLEASFRAKAECKHCCSHFFEIRYFKKGTIHLIWRDQSLLDDFNYKLGELRGWELANMYDKKNI